MLGSHIFFIALKFNRRITTMKNKLIMLLVILYLYPAHADDYKNFNSDGQKYKNFNSSKDDNYRSWNNVKSMLGTKGVNAEKIDWKAVEAGCKDSTYRAPDQYNKCKYDNAIKYTRYIADVNYCNAFAEQQYFAYIDDDNHDIIINNTVERRNGIETRVETRSKNRDKEEFKDSSSTLCMRDLGWDASGSWLAGKSSSYQKNRYNKKHRQ